MSKPEEKVTDAELAVMQVLWEAEEPVTLAQVKAALAGRNGDTTKTLLRCVRRERSGRRSGRFIIIARWLGARSWGITAPAA